MNFVHFNEIIGTLGKTPSRAPLSLVSQVKIFGFSDGILCQKDLPNFLKTLKTLANKFFLPKISEFCKTTNNSGTFALKTLLREHV